MASFTPVRYTRSPRRRAGRGAHDVVGTAPQHLYLPVAVLTKRHWIKSSKQASPQKGQKAHPRDRHKELVRHARKHHEERKNLQASGSQYVRQFPEKKPDTAQPVTPRREYENTRHALSDLCVDLMMQLDRAALSNMRDEWIARQEAHERMDRYDFAAMVQQEIKDTQGKYLEALLEIFREIDVNGDGNLEWEEFTSYLVELANAYYKDGYEEHISHFIPDRTVDETHHDYAVDFCKYFENLRNLVVIERSSTRFKLYDENLNLVHTVKAHRAACLVAEALPQLHLLVTTSADRTMCFWDSSPTALVPWQLKFQWTCPHAQITALWNDYNLYTSETTGDVLAWYLDDGTVKCRMKGHTDVPMGLCVVPRQHKLASVSLDTTMRVWDVETGICTMVMEDHTKPLLGVTHSNDYNVLVSGGMDNFALGYSPTMKRPVFSIRGFSPKSHVVGLVNIRNTVIATADDGTTQVVDLRNFRTLQTFTVPKLKHASLSCTTAIPKQDVVIAAGAKIHRFVKSKSADPTKTFDEPITYAQYNSDDMTVIVAAGDSVKIFSVLTGQMEREFLHIRPCHISAICLDKRQRRMFIGDNQGEINVYNYHSGAWMKKVESHSAEVSALLHVDIRSEHLELLSCSWDGTVVSHVDQMEVAKTTRRRFHDHTKDVTCLALSLRHSMLATAGNDTRVILYHYSLGLGDQFTQIKHGFVVTALHFLADEPLLVVADALGNVCVYLIRGHAMRLHHWINSTLNGRVFAINMFDYVPETKRLYAVDDGGYWKCFDLKDLISTVYKAEDTPAVLQFDGTLRSPIARRRHHMHRRRSSTRKQNRLPQKNLPTIRIGAGPSPTPAVPPSPAYSDAGCFDSPSLRRHHSATREQQPSTTSFADSLALPKRRGHMRARSSGHYDELKEKQRGGPTRSRVRRLSVAFRFEDNWHPGMLSGPCKVVQAHEGPAVGLQFIHSAEHSPLLLTWGFDGLAVLWNAITGQRLGILQQGYNKHHNKPLTPWNVQVDLVSRKQQEQRVLMEDHDIVQQRLLKRTETKKEPVRGVSAWSLTELLEPKYDVYAEKPLRRPFPMLPPLKKRDKNSTSSAEQLRRIFRLTHVDDELDPYFLDESSSGSDEDRKAKVDEKEPSDASSSDGDDSMYDFAPSPYSAKSRSPFRQGAKRFNALRLAGTGSRIHSSRGSARSGDSASVDEAANDSMDPFSVAKRVSKRIDDALKGTLPLPSTTQPKFVASPHHSMQRQTEPDHLAAARTVLEPAETFDSLQPHDVRVKLSTGKTATLAARGRHIGDAATRKASAVSGAASSSPTVTQRSVRIGKRKSLQKGGLVVQDASGKDTPSGVRIAPSVRVPQRNRARQATTPVPTRAGAEKTMAKSKSAAVL